MTLIAPEYVRQIAPYQAGRPISEIARKYGLDEAGIVKLASNENPLGMSPAALEAMQAAIGELARYPDSNGFDLKAALSAHYDVPQDWITLGNGSNDVLELAAHAILEPGASCVYSEHAFAVYALATQETGARAIVAPARDFGHDMDAMAAAIEPDTRVVFIANPNNPTGTFVPHTRIEAFLEQVPADVVVVLDEAYNEFLEPGLRFDTVEWVRRHPNLIVARTFSKAYGLAGLRIGFGLAQPELTDLMNRVRQPFNVNSLAMAAAIAALGDRDFLERSYRCNRDGLRQLTEAFDQRGLRWIPSFGNFVAVHVGDGARVFESLLRQGVIVRPIGGYGMPQWLRVSVGLESENQTFIAALDQSLADRPA